MPRDETVNAALIRSWRLFPFTMSIQQCRVRRAYESWHSVFRYSPRHDPAKARLMPADAARPPFVTEADTVRRFYAIHAFLQIFFRQPERDLHKTRILLNLTNRQSACKLDLWVKVRAPAASDREDSKRCSTTNRVEPVSQRKARDSRLRESVQQPNGGIKEFGEAADPDGTWRWLINKLRKSNWVSSAIPRKSPAIAPQGAKRLRALPKSCHLLPSTAILNRKTATSVSTVTFVFLPKVGVPASRGSAI